MAKIGDRSKADYLYQMSQGYGAGLNDNGQGENRVDPNFFFYNSDPNSPVVMKNNGLFNKSPNVQYRSNKNINAGVLTDNGNVWRPALMPYEQWKRLQDSGAADPNYQFEHPLPEQKPHPGQAIKDMAGNANLYNGTAALNTPTHTMPDGTVHPGATHEEYLEQIALKTGAVPGRNPNQVVADQLTANFPDAQSILQQSSQLNDDALTTRALDALRMAQEGEGISNEPTLTDKKRNRTNYGEMLMDRLNNADPGMMTGAEKLMRVGGEIVGASNQGGLAAMQAAGQSYGAIQDYERTQRQQQIENQIDLQDKSGIDAEDRMEMLDQVGVFESELSKMDEVLTALRVAKGDGYGDITGPVAGTLGARFDAMSTDERAQYRADIRLVAEKLRVSAILENTANTKGAISDKEMALFESPVPPMTAQEGVWIRWIERRQRILQQVVNRMRNNIYIDPNSEIGSPIVISESDYNSKYGSSRGGGSSQSRTTPQSSNNTYSQEDADVLNQYGLGQ